MILANERSKYYGDLLQHVRGAVFFGVPHRGSDIAYWAGFAANILQFGQLGLGTNSAYVKALERNSPTFANISTQFVDRAERLSIRTFYETERMGTKVVSSSRLPGLLRTRTHDGTDCGQKLSHPTTSKRDRGRCGAVQS
jgi:hypothetical protein